MSKDEKIKYILANPGKTYSHYAKVLGHSSVDGVRQFFKRHKLPNLRNNIQAKRTELDLPMQITKAIKNRRRTIVDLADLFDVAPKQIQAAINELKVKNSIIDNFTDGGIQMAKDMMPIEEPHKIDMSKHKETEISFGFVADSHIGSKYERNDVLEALYDRFAEYGIDTVYHGGNWIDGEARFNKHDIYVHGIEAQVENFIKKYPQRKGMKTYIISGDDHEGWYVQREHINIGQKMEDEAKRAGRDDLIDLGYMERDIELKQPNGSAILRVIHAGGGSSYATSYTSQKYVESLQGGEKPHIVLVGHYHKFDYSYPREVHVVQGGCTEDQTPFMRKKKLQANIGGCVIHIKQASNGVITSFKVEWLPFYDKKFYEYKW